MRPIKLNYFLLFITTIITGLLSRRISIVPTFVGDILYATMVYWMVRLLFTSKSVTVAAIAALAFCYAVEISQLYKAPSINEIRGTLPGRLILGNTFLWTDLVCYAVGVVLGLLMERLLLKI